MTGKVEVNNDVFSLFNDNELHDISQLNEFDRRIEHSEQSEITLHKKTLSDNIPLEDIIISKIRNGKLKEMLIFIIALISFVCGCIFSRCVLPSIIEYVQYEDFTYSLGIYDYISMIIVYFIVIIIASAPVISKYVKNISISEKRLG